MPPQKLLYMLIVCLAFFIAGSAAANNVKVRPVDIKVVDAVTKQPLEGILIYYILESYSYKDKMLFFLPRPEPKQIVNIEIKNAIYTDSKGEVHFSEKDLNLKNDFELFKENIYINLDIKTEALWREDKTRDKIENVHYYVPIYATSKEMFINPNGIFKGFRIQSTTWHINPEDWGGSTRDKFNILWNGKGLLKEREVFVVELERYK